MHGHIVAKSVYFLVFFTLLALTALTTAIAFVDLGAMNTVAALAIAVTKATLVVLFFMHVKYSPGLTRIVVVAGFFWLAILLALTLSDFFTRSWTPIPSGWQSSISSTNLERSLSRREIMRVAMGGLVQTFVFQVCASCSTFGLE